MYTRRFVEVEGRMYIRLYAMPLEQTDYKLPGAQDYKFCSGLRELF